MGVVLRAVRSLSEIKLHRLVLACASPSTTLLLYDEFDEIEDSWKKLYGDSCALAYTGH